METNKHHQQTQSKLVVLGAGESGVGAAILAIQKGFDVFVSDFGNIQEGYKEQLLREGIRFEQNKHTDDEILNAELVIKSPGISNKAPIVQKIIQKGILVLSEIEFAAQYTNGKLICITGSNGKSTTATLTWYILKNAGLNVALAGNIGNSFALQVATGDADFYVLEISSFMLDDMKEFRADIAVLLNITPD